jgi:hypothetical protein
VLGGIVAEREQLAQVAGDLRGGLRELRAVGSLECAGGGQGVRLVLGVPDLRQGLLRPRVRGLRQRGQDIGDLMEPAPGLPGLGEDLPQRAPVRRSFRPGLATSSCQLLQLIGPP